MNQTNGGIIKGESQENVRERSRDLATRERVNFVISSEIMFKLRQRAERTSMPMSRIVDIALSLYFEQPLNSPLNAKETGIDLYHRFEMIVFESYTSEPVQTCSNLMKKYLKNYTSTSCLLRNEEKDGESMIGTKFFSFVADTQQENLSGLLNETALWETKPHMEILLDKQPLSI